MITMQALALWFLFSSVLFVLFNVLVKDLCDGYRSVNTFFVLLAQGFGAVIVAWMIK